MIDERLRERVAYYLATKRATVSSMKGLVASHFGWAHLCALASLREIYLLMQHCSRKVAKPQRKTAK